MDVFFQKRFVQTGTMACCSCKHDVYKHVRYNNIMLDIVQCVVYLLLANMTLRTFLCPCLCAICCHSAESHFAIF